MSFGDKQLDETTRDTIVAVVFDQQSKTFLCQYWPDYSGLTCLLSGGVEPNEDADAAVIREVTEETGYDDFTVAGILGENIEMHYVKPSGEKYLKNITPYLVVLNSLNSIGHAREEDEKFDNLFRTPDEILAMMQDYETRTESSLEDHKEVLRRGVQYLNRTTPHF